MLAAIILEVMDKQESDSLKVNTEMNNKTIYFNLFILGYDLFNRRGVTRILFCQ